MKTNLKVTKKCVLGGEDEEVKNLELLEMTNKSLKIKRLELSNCRFFETDFFSQIDG